MSAGDATSTSEERFAAAVGRRPLWVALASRGQLRRWLIASPAAAVFGGLFIAPVAFFFVMSFWRKKAMRLVPDFTFENYVETWEKYAGVIVITLGIALATAVLTTAIAF